MKKIENKRKFISIVLIVVIIIGTVFALKINNTKELTQFDITVTSYVNETPIITNESTIKAHFTFKLDGIEKYDFFNEYEIESIKLNGNLINNSDIYYDSDNSFITVYSKDYKMDNEIEIIIKNKNTTQKYLKKLEVKTNVIM